MAIRGETVFLYLLYGFIFLQSTGYVLGLIYNKRLRRRKV